MTAGVSHVDSPVSLLYQYCEKHTIYQCELVIHNIYQCELIIRLTFWGMDNTSRKIVETCAPVAGSVDVSHVIRTPG